MRKQLLVLIILFTCVINYAQTTVTIPDDAFEAYLEATFATNITADGSTTDGSITFTDINLVTDINFSESGKANYMLVTTASDLTGVNSFPKLKNLYCSNNVITGTLDVSGLASLTNFSCFNNPGLTAINLTGCKKLYNFKANDCALTTIDLSVATLDAAADPTRLRYVVLKENSLTSVNIAGNTGLYTLDIYNNTDLTSIDISESTLLTRLRFQNCNITGSIDVSKNSGLTTLGAYDNDNLASINLGAIPYGQITYFKTIYSNNLKTIYSDNPTDFIIGGNLATAIGGSYEVDAHTVFKSSALLTSWTGSTDTVWETVGNWSNGLPNSTKNITIENGLTNYPVIDSDVEINELVINVGATIKINSEKSLKVLGSFAHNDVITIESGGSLIAQGNLIGTANITYNTTVTDTNWHLVSSPVEAEGYDDAWVTANSIASGAVSSSNRGIATYQNGTANGTTGQWVYMQGGATGTFGSGTGYSLKRTGAGNYSFTGTFPSSDVATAITQNVNNWNLIGNPYPSYINIATLISNNTANLGGAFQAVYVWNAGTGSYDDLTTGHIHQGQAFFISSNVASGNLSFTEAMQSHQTGVTFYKTQSNPYLDLILSDGTNSKTTQINYLDNKTTSLDAGFDIGLFNGVSSDIEVYTHLLDNNEGIAFKRQALPNNDFENLIIPIGVNAKAGKEVTFSLNANNLPDGINVYLEDRSNNVYTHLNEVNSNLKITFEDDVNGTGRFYLHTTSNTLSVNNIAVLNSLSIYKTDTFHLKITGLPQGKSTVSLFNILGKQVMTASFNANGAKDISLRKLAAGVYVVKVQTEIGKASKKIILE